MKYIIPALVVLPPPTIFSKCCLMSGKGSRWRFWKRMHKNNASTAFAGIRKADATLWQGWCGEHHVQSKNPWYESERAQGRTHDGHQPGIWPQYIPTIVCVWHSMANHSTGKNETLNLVTNAGGNLDPEADAELLWNVLAQALEEQDPPILQRVLMAIRTEAGQLFWFYFIRCWKRRS